MMDTMETSARTPETSSDTAAVRRPPTGLRAMVVEDEAPLANLVGTYLEHDGFEVTITGDGADAVVLARQFDPDVVVLDLGLPHLDGVEVCRQLRTFSDAYVVILTARSDEVDTLIGLSVGADDYMSKPFSPRELVTNVQAMIAGKTVAAGANTGDNNA